MVLDLGPCPADDVPVAFFVCKRAVDDAVGAAEREVVQRVACDDGCELAFTMVSHRLVEEIEACKLRKAETGLVYAIEGTVSCLGGH